MLTLKTKKRFFSISAVQIRKTENEKQRLDQQNKCKCFPCGIENSTMVILCSLTENTFTRRKSTK